MNDLSYDINSARMRPGLARPYRGRGATYELMSRQAQSERVGGAKE